MPQKLNEHDLAASCFTSCLCIVALALIVQCAGGCSTDASGLEYESVDAAIDGAVDDSRDSLPDSQVTDDCLTCLSISRIGKPPAPPPAPTYTHVPYYSPFIAHENARATCALKGLMLPRTPLLVDSRHWLHGSETCSYGYQTLSHREDCHVAIHAQIYCVPID